MAFVKKTWKDRLVEYAGRRKITNVTTLAAQIVDVERAEGIVSEEGSAFSAANLNDFEQRVADGFADVQQDVDGVISDLDALNDAGAIQGLEAREDGVYITYTPVAGADTVTKKLGSGIGVLNELTLYWYRDSQELSGAWFGGGGESTVALNVSNCNTICITTVSKSSNTGDDPGNAYYYRSSSESQNLISSGTVIDVSNTDTLWIRCVGGGNLPGRGSRRGTITLRDIVYN